jgi:hypothetical protein
VSTTSTVGSCDVRLIMMSDDSWGGELSIPDRPNDPRAIALIREALMNTDWTYLYELDVNTACADFTDKLTSLYERHVPVKEAIIPARFIVREEWMTTALIKSSRTLSKLYKKCVKKSKNDPSYVRYTEYRNRYNQLKRTAKQQHYQRRFDQYKTDIKGTWRLLNTLIGRMNDKSSIQTTFIQEGNLLNTPNDIANGFCDYFSNIGPKLATAIPPPKKNFNQYLMSQPHERSQNVQSMFLLPTDAAREIDKIISGLKPKKSSGQDKLSSVYLK